MGSVVMSFTCLTCGSIHNYNSPMLPACRCVGPRQGVVRRWRVPKGWTCAARVAAGVFFGEAIGVAGFNLDCGDRGILIGIWIQVDHNISFYLVWTIILIIVEEPVGGDRRPTNSQYVYMHICIHIYICIGRLNKREQEIASVGSCSTKIKTQSAQPLLAVCLR